MTSAHTLSRNAIPVEALYICQFLLRYQHCGTCSLSNQANGDCCRLLDPILCVSEKTSDLLEYGQDEFRNSIVQTLYKLDKVNQCTTI